MTRKGWKNDTLSEMAKSKNMVGFNNLLIDYNQVVIDLKNYLSCVLYTILNL